MSISVPTRLFDMYNETMDMFLSNDNFSRLCTIIYPSLKTPCTQCVTGGNGTYSHGGPALAGNDNCAFCGGVGYKDSEVTGSIRLRIYWNKKNWITGQPAQISDAVVQVIGYTVDLPKLLRADSILLVSEQKELEQSYRITGDPFYHGFGKNRYFVAYLGRA